MLILMQRLILIILLGLGPILNAQSNMNGFYCDPETGLCVIPEVEDTAAPAEVWKEDEEIIYVGDPMCSWCWGISPALHQLELQAAGAGIPFRIVVGGLRPGGGDPWNDQFQKFLKHHWEEVNQRSGQPFGFDLFERDNFNYDTEPSCRAVVAARLLDPTKEHRFFELVQHHFYVRNEDPTQAAFYEPICKTLGLDYQQFLDRFNAQDVRDLTRAEFALNRQWGVRGYPTVIFRKGEKLYSLAGGYATFEQMWAQLQNLSGVQSNP